MCARDEKRERKGDVPNISRIACARVAQNCRLAKCQRFHDADILTVLRTENILSIVGGAR